MATRAEWEGVIVEEMTDAKVIAMSVPDFKLLRTVDKNTTRAVVNSLANRIGVQPPPPRVTVNFYQGYITLSNHVWGRRVALGLPIEDDIGGGGGGGAGVGAGRGNRGGSQQMAPGSNARYDVGSDRRYNFEPNSSLNGQLHMARDQSPWTVNFNAPQQQGAALQQGGASGAPST